LGRDLRCFVKCFGHSDLFRNEEAVELTLAANRQFEEALKRVREKD